MTEDSQHVERRAGTPSPGRGSTKSLIWIAVIGVAAVYWFTRGGGGLLPGWTDQLEPALAKAVDGGQAVLVYFSVPG